MSAASDGPLAGLRRFVRPRPASESRCELCAANLISSEHQHLLEIESNRVVCCCDACAILFSDGAEKYRRIPKSVRLLADFVLTGAQWDSLAIPINLAFFRAMAGSGKAVAFYPSPAGATESLLPLGAWQDIVEQNPILRTMQPEVETLLINRVTKPHEYYLAPLDDCYKLIGLIRSNWRGFSGGADVWQSIAAFFISLKRRSTRIGTEASCPS